MHIFHFCLLNAWWYENGYKKSISSYYFFLRMLWKYICEFFTLLHVYYLHWDYINDVLNFRWE